MKVFMTGGSGFVGAFLSRELAQEGHEVTILTRQEPLPAPSQPGISFLGGDPTREDLWMVAVSDHDWVINLAGASIFTRWSAKTKKAVYDSRLRTTRNLVLAMARGPAPQLFCSTSAVGVYGPRGEETITEDSPPGSDFLAGLAQDWEAEALKAQKLGTRVVLTRFGVVLGREGGALGQMIPAFKMFLGGPVGSGEQWFSWIHQLDHARAFLFIKDTPTLSGPVNLTSPNPVRNRELAQALGRVLHRPSFMPAPALVLRLALGEFADVLLEGQRALPRKLLDAGFQFLFPTIEEALKDLLG